MTIRVYHNRGNLLNPYTVQIEKDVFAISERGINQYVGPAECYDFSKCGEEVTYNDIPETIRQAIRENCTRIKNGGENPK